MKMKSMVLLAVAVACGLVAMLGVQQMVSNGKASAKEEAVLRVLVSTAEISPGTPLDGKNSEFRELPEALVPEGAVTSPEQFLERAPKSRLFPGDVITVNKLGEKGDRSASQTIPAGMRVVTVAVNLTKTHSGLVKPGDFVDLQVTYQSRHPAMGLITKSKTFMQNIEVFATDNIRTNEGTGVDEVKAKNISLLVTPDDANLLKLAEKAGELHLVLRGQGDVVATEVKDVDLQMLEDLGGSVDRRDYGGHPGEVDDTDGDVRGFLGSVSREDDRDHAAEPTEEPVVVREPVVELPRHEVWVLEIRAGEDVSTEEILIPIERPEPTAAFVFPTTASAGKEAGVVASATSGVVSALKRVLNGSRRNGDSTDDTDETAADAGTATEAIAPTLDELIPQVDDLEEPAVPELDESTLDGTLPRELLAP